MQAMILHPTESTPVPVTLVATKRPRKKPARKPGPQGLTLAELRIAVKSRGLKPTTKHTKPELLAMLTTGQYVRPAQYDRDAAKRKAKKA